MLGHEKAPVSCALLHQGAFLQNSLVRADVSGISQVIRWLHSPSVSLEPLLNPVFAYRFRRRAAVFQFFSLRRLSFSNEQSEYTSSGSWNPNGPVEVC